MNLTFKTNGNSQKISAEELNEFEILIGRSLPQDYKNHMLQYNGGILLENVDHVNYENMDKGISKFYPIKYGGMTMEFSFSSGLEIFPVGYLSIGKTKGQGEILMNIIESESYGKIIEWYPDGEINELSQSFTHLLNDMMESEE